MSLLIDFSSIILVFQLGTECNQSFQAPASVITFLSWWTITWDPELSKPCLLWVSFVQGVLSYQAKKKLVQEPFLIFCSLETFRQQNLSLRGSPAFKHITGGIFRLASLFFLKEVLFEYNSHIKSIYKSWLCRSTYFLINQTILGNQNQHQQSENYPEAPVICLFSPSLPSEWPLSPSVWTIEGDFCIFLNCIRGGSHRMTLYGLIPTALCECVVVVVPSVCCCITFYMCP